MATSVSLSAQGLIVYGVVLISAITSGGMVLEEAISSSPGNPDPRPPALRLFF